MRLNLVQRLGRPATAASRTERVLHLVLPHVYRRLGKGVAARAATEFLAFGIKQAYACLYGALLLALILGTRFLYPADAALARYDFLFLAALALQVWLLAARLETLDEAKVILIFHVVGTAMEVFKTAAGSWIYPEESFFRIGGVPLFSGFMYAAVGSYLARISRIFDFRYSHYPPLWTTWAFAIAIYVNFFTHHYTVDIRLGLFALLFLLYGRTFVHYSVYRYRHRMPLVLGFFLVAVFIWFAENIGTFAQAWRYPDQADGWRLVSLAKLNAWVLLMIISFVLVTLVNKPRKE
ncbi:MAG: hypothetical protein CML67_12195 [Rhodobacteraceae bacterium]|uniref:DUF817 domain-containing protein n=1 Tax=Stappia stellulata TaxID=71235 RepID=UPI000C6AC10C|nr:DUF817 domain-containing protein [Stappia stellulata]MBC00291.1 hypothetical protein [Paracoccaceae bacterium]MCA1244232.1 DUF817 domain-containing protein [Stappia stellulata]